MTSYFLSGLGPAARAATATAAASRAIDAPGFATDSPVITELP
jgi:hypothetical protein